jgi:hypothetical protein
VLRYNLLAERHPGATDGELTALWVEDTYRDSMDPVALAKACRAIRETGSADT